VTLIDVQCSLRLHPPGSPVPSAAPIAALPARSVISESVSMCSTWAAPAAWHAFHSLTRATAMMYPVICGRLLLASRRSPSVKVLSPTCIIRHDSPVSRSL